MISAIVLAAGQSSRMGQPKMFMPWGGMTVIEKVISTLIEADVNDIHVITGGNEDDLKKTLSAYDINYINNKDFANGEMLISVQVGMDGLGDDCEAALIVLGDQPQMKAEIIQEILERYELTYPKIIVPSYQMRRGHPWLVEKTYWQDIRNLIYPATLRNFLNAHNDDIEYLIVDSPSVIQDLDTQDDYLQYKP